ncbi:MAG TPA: PIN domain-containing protein [Nakamurella sp.]
MIVDTSALLAFFDRDEPDHDAVASVLDGTSEPLVVSPFVVAELDYLVATQLGVDAEIATFRELSGGAWDLAAFDTDDLTELVPIIEKYHDQQIGVADASNVLLAARHDTRTIATLDRRHFSVLRPLAGGRFTVVP